MAPDRPEVLTSLPRSRPTRRSAKRGGPSEGEAQAAEAPKPKAAPKKKPAAAKAKAKAKAAPAKAKPAAKPKPKAKAKPAAKPKTAAKPKAKAAPKKPRATAAKRTPLKEAPSRRKPEAVSQGAPGLDEFPSDPVSGPVDPPSGGELLQSAAKAAGEIAQAGITVGREALKTITKRLPRP
jgi:membrane protein involved in colicin uptake